MKITISNNGENRTVVEDKPRVGGRFNWSRLGPVTQGDENANGQPRGHGKPGVSGQPRRSANDRLIRNGGPPGNPTAVAVRDQPSRGGKGGKGRGGTGKPKKSANERLVRAPQAPSAMPNAAVQEINNNERSEPMEIDIHPPVRIACSSPLCICLRPVKMVLCRICGKNFEGRVQKTCKEHPMDTYLLDVQRCPRSTCQAFAKDLLEYPLPKNYVPVKINTKLV